MRDGVPLPGWSPTEVLSQVAYRVFGPLHPDRVRVVLDYRVRLVLDYHGMDGQPAGRLAEVAARQHGHVQDRVEPCRGGVGGRCPAPADRRG